MRWPWQLAWPTLFFGCLRAEVRESAPSGIDFWAAMFGSGDEATFSALVETDSDLAAAGPEALTLVGWSREHIVDAPGETPLRVATACEAKLPPPTYVSDPDAIVPDITADWVSCPTQKLTAYVECVGTGESCATTIRQNGCDAIIETCPYFPDESSKRVRLDGQGGGCAVELGESCTLGPGDELGKIACEGDQTDCSMQILRVPSEPLFRESLRIRVAETPVPENQDGDVSWNGLNKWGRSADLAIAGDTLLVALTDQAVRTFQPCEKTDFLAISALDGALVGTSSIAGCFEAVGAAPDESGFRAFDGVSLVELSLEAEIQRTLRIPSEGPVRAAHLISTPDQRVLVRTKPEFRVGTTGCEESEVLVIDEATSAEPVVTQISLQSDLVSNRCLVVHVGSAFVRDGIAGMVDDQADALLLYDLRRQRLEGLTLALTFGGASVDPNAVFATPDSQIWIVGLIGNNEGILSVPETRIPSRTVRFEHLGPPTAFTDGYDRNSVIYAGQSGEGAERTAYLGVFDLGLRRPRPGELEVGPGIISRLVRHGSAVWALLPWSEELVRIEPSPTL